MAAKHARNGPKTMSQLPDVGVGAVAGAAVGEPSNRADLGLNLTPRPRGWTQRRRKCTNQRQRQREPSSERHRPHGKARWQRISWTRAKQKKKKAGAIGAMFAMCAIDVEVIVHQTRDRTARGPTRCPGWARRRPPGARRPSSRAARGRTASLTMTHQTEAMPHRRMTDRSTHRTGYAAPSASRWR